MTATQAAGEWWFTVAAIGDLDGDGVFSTFSRSANTQTWKIQGSRIEISDEPK